MTETLGALMNRKNSLKLKQDDSGRASILRTPINTLGDDRIQIKDNIYDLTPEIYKALSCTGYTGKTMKKKKDILMMKNIVRDLGYTGVGDRDSKHFSQKLFQNWLRKFKTKLFMKLQTTLMIYEEKE